MSELRVGGLAIIIGLKQYAHYNGKCVQLDQLVNEGELFKSPINDRIWIQDMEGYSWIVTGDVTHPDGEYGWGALSPVNLMPIDGEDFSHEDERQKELTNG